jgi:hypothetical protein
MAPIRNITSETFAALSKTFMDLNDGRCFELSVEPWIKDGNDRDATLKEWLAWRDYRKSKGMKVLFMDSRALDNKTWTVPALWPHEFDSDRTVQQDHAASARVQDNPFRDKTNRLEPRRHVGAVISPFMPFKQLWDAFGHDEPQLLYQKTFGAMQDAARALATHGKDHARPILLRNTEKL